MWGSRTEGCISLKYRRDKSNFPEYHDPADASDSPKRLKHQSWSRFYFLSWPSVFLRKPCHLTCHWIRLFKPSTSCPKKSLARLQRPLIRMSSCWMHGRGCSPRCWWGSLAGEGPSPVTPAACVCSAVVPAEAVMCLQSVHSHNWLHWFPDLIVSTSGSVTFFCSNPKVANRLLSPTQSL